jgi:hypothetical protein
VEDDRDIAADRAAANPMKPRVIANPPQLARMPKHPSTMLSTPIAVTPPGRPRGGML